MRAGRDRRSDGRAARVLATLLAAWAGTIAMPGNASAEISSLVVIPLPETLPPVGSDQRPNLHPKVTVALPETPPPVPTLRDIPLTQPTIPPVTVAASAPPPPSEVPAPERQEMPAPVPAPAQPTMTPSPPAPTASEGNGGVTPEMLEKAIAALVSARASTGAEVAAIQRFYAARGNRPLFLDGAGWGPRADAVRRTLAEAHREGLEPAHYRSVGAFHGGERPHGPGLAAAEAGLALAVVRYARDASIGRINPRQVHELITPELRAPAPDAVLTAIAEATDAEAALAAYNPPHEGYRALRERLAEARAERVAFASASRLPPGPPIRVGMRDPRVPLIRARLGLGFDNSPVYDRALSVQVASLQRQAGLPVNGILTAETLDLLDGTRPSRDEAEIIANMERWRWLPRDLGAEHLLVNVPELTVRIVRNGRTVHSARTIVGKDETQTPVFSDVMDHIVMNPSWFVPPGILKREPKYLDPAWAAARGYEIRTSRNGVTTVRVPPSGTNALGNVKFMFPNIHAVYLHDTPNRSLFGAANRTLSNGCVRVENPMQLAALLFESEGWTEQRFRALIGRGERTMRLPRPMPVHLTYFTLTTDEAGNLVRHPDLYGHSARMRAMMAWRT
jgi:murein L,D-transpeptidase YcbB/YkuD